MGEHKNKTYPLRINNDLRLKIEFIAETEVRKLSQQYELIIKKYIDEYELHNGKLIIDEDGKVHKEDIYKLGRSSNLKSG
jgi:hypothetical protein